MKVLTSYTFLIWSTLLFSSENILTISTSTPSRVPTSSPLFSPSQVPSPPTKKPLQPVQFITDDTIPTYLPTIEPSISPTYEPSQIPSYSQIPTTTQKPTTGAQVKSDTTTPFTLSPDAFIGVIVISGVILVCCLVLSCFAIDRHKKKKNNEEIASWVKSQDERSHVQAFKKDSDASIETMEHNMNEQVFAQDYNSEVSYNSNNLPPRPPPPPLRRTNNQDQDSVSYLSQQSPYPTYSNDQNTHPIPTNSYLQSQFQNQDYGDDDESSRRSSITYNSRP